MQGGDILHVLYYRYKITLAFGLLQIQSNSSDQGYISLKGKAQETLHETLINV